VIEAQGIGMDFLSLLCRNMLNCVQPLRERAAATLNGPIQQERNLPPQS
jgi:hypothetical protein